MEWAWLHVEVLVAAGVVIVAIAVIMVYLTVKAHRGKVATGIEGIVGERGLYKGNGQCLVRGELWHIINTDDLAPGDRIEVVALERLQLKVRKIQS
jgi:membrane-bound serine protease (ClpP class)